METEQLETKGSIKRVMESTLGSKAVFERAHNSIPSGSTRAPYYYAPYPLYITKGEGCYISDLDGNKYIDFANNMGPLILGHRYPSVQKRVMQQVDALWCGGPTELEVSLAEKVLEAFPMTDRLLFTPSGSEADMKLIRAARAMTRRKMIMMSTGAFHGTSDTLMPGPGVPPEIERLIARYRYNDQEGFLTQFRKVKDSLAAVILEGVLGSAGSVPPTRGFLQTIREETEKHGVPLIFDEVVTGFRVARGGIAERFRIKPDGVALGKIIGGGFPVGALLGTRELMKAFEYSSSDFPMLGSSEIKHAGTFNAHPVTMASGLATLEVLDDQAYGHLEKFGADIRDSLEELAVEHKVPHCITGISSMFRLHFSDEEIKDYETTSKYSNEKKERIFDSLLLANGILVPYFHTAFCSTPMGAGELAKFGDSVDRALAEMKDLA